MRDNLIPILFFLFMVINIYLDKTKRKKRRHEERDKQQNEQAENGQQQPEIIIDPAPGQEKPDDLAAEFERRLKKTTQAAEAAKAREQGRVVTDGANVRHDAGVVHDDKNRVRRESEPKRNYKRVHTDTEAQHEMHGRVHRDKEAFAHDKGKVYYDPRGDYSYDEAKMNAAAAAFNARYAQEEPVQKLRVHLKHKALVQGFIMSEVLAKPRALKPYEDDAR